MKHFSFNSKAVFSPTLLAKTKRKLYKKSYWCQNVVAVFDQNPAPPPETDTGPPRGTRLKNARSLAIAAPVPALPATGGNDHAPGTTSGPASDPAPDHHSGNTRKSDTDPHSVLEKRKYCVFNVLNGTFLQFNVCEESKECSIAALLVVKERMKFGRTAKNQIPNYCSLIFQTMADSRSSSEECSR